MLCPVFMVLGFYFTTELSHLMLLIFAVEISTLCMSVAQIKLLLIKLKKYIFVDIDVSA